MARPKKLVEEAKANLPQAQKEKYRCTCCGTKYTNQETNFYQSNSLIVKSNNGRMFVCKRCVVELFTYLVTTYEDTQKSLYLLCRWLDLFYDANLYYSAEQHARNSNTNVSQTYITKVNSLPQYAGLTFNDSASLDGTKNEFLTKEQQETNTSIWSDEDKRNKDDVIRMVGYDPFENENPQDKKYLYNTLVDFLDESTLEDSFKLPIVIEIVKSFNQIDKINQALAIITTDVNSISSQVGGVKSLFDAKQKIYSSILAMAKDNGISVNHNNQKSKGAGTLTGIIKKLQEIGLNEVRINLFDIETSDGMKQVADISNQSILQQLVFDENDYTDMIKEQRIMLEDLRNKYLKLEEENRLLKLEVGDN